jgi:hypothetical protein
MTLIDRIGQALAHPIRAWRLAARKRAVFQWMRDCPRCANWEPDAVEYLLYGNVEVKWH